MRSSGIDYLIRVPFLLLTPGSQPNIFASSPACPCSFSPFPTGIQNLQSKKSSEDIKASPLIHPHFWSCSYVSDREPRSFRDEHGIDRRISVKISPLQTGLANSSFPCCLSSIFIIDGLLWCCFVQRSCTSRELLRARPVHYDDPSPWIHGRFTTQICDRVDG